MKNDKKHVISLALALAMLLSCMPGIALVTNAAPQYDRPEGRSIVVGYDDYVGEDWAEKLLETLPTAATVDGAGENAITWPTANEIKQIVNPEEVGYYYIPGTVEGVANAVTVTIQVREKTNLVYNGDFATRTSSTAAPGWAFGWGKYIMENPEKADDYVVRISKSSAADNTQVLYVKKDDGIPYLTSGIKAAGVGQYYMQLDAKSVEYVSGSTTVPARTDISIKPVMMSAATENATSGFKTMVTGTAVTLTTEWTTIGHQFDITELAGTYRLDLKGTVVTASAYFYCDNFEVFALNVALKAEDEPAPITDIKNPGALGVVKDYDKYVGEGNWKGQLGLPSEVDVITSEGTGTVAVEWDYDSLDLSTVGRYVLTGTLDDSAYTNPDNLTAQQVVYVREKRNLISYGDFESGAVGTEWFGTGYLSIQEDGDNGILRGRKSSAVADKVYTLAYQTVDYETALAEAMKLEGKGQYYLKMDAKAVPYNDYAPLSDLYAWMVFRYTPPAGKATTLETSESLLLTPDWAENAIMFEFDMDSEDYTSLRTELKFKTIAGGYAAAYFDNLELIPLRVALTAEDCTTLGHNYDEGVVTTKPTCTEVGIKTYTCTACGDTNTEEVAALGHTAGNAVVTKPTCTEAGYTTCTCSVCGISYTADEVAALGHTPSNGVVTLPTCTQIGYTTYTCTVCGDSYNVDVVAPSGHTCQNGICLVCGANEWDTDGDGVLEILAIGNSFSVDALRYVWQISKNLGINAIVIGNLYIPSCTLEMHITNANNDSASYTYYYNDNGTWETNQDYKISTALAERDWDFVSLQQQSGNSGLAVTYNEDLTDLIDYVKERSYAKLVWHMTWAYQQDSTHSAFAYYGKDQMTMYNAILSATQNKICTNSNFDLIVPSGTAVQNSRTSLLGDTTTRDGYHMTTDYGRYLTGLMFVKMVTGLPIDGVTYAPSGVDAKEKAIAIESVNNAYTKPFAVTNSAYSSIIKGATVDLGNSLDMNFYIDPADLDENETYIAKIVRSYADGRTNDELTVPVDKTKIDTKNGNYIYVTYGNIAAKEMGDKIAVTIYDSKNNAVSETYTDSVKDYAVRALERYANEEKTVQVLKDLLNYGAAAQAEFEYDVENPVDSDLSDIRDITVDGVATGNDAKKGTTLTLKSNILMEMFFFKDKVGNATTATVSYTNHKGTLVTNTVDLVEDSYYLDAYKVQIEGLVIADINTEVTVTVGDIEVTDTMAWFVKRSADTDIFSAILALGDSAYAYFH